MASLPLQSLSEVCRVSGKVSDRLLQPQSEVRSVSREEGVSDVIADSGADSARDEPN